MSNLSIARRDAEVGRKMFQTSAGAELGWAQPVIFYGSVPVLVGEDVSRATYAAVVGCKDTKLRLQPEDGEDAVDALIRKLNEHPDVVLALRMAGELSARPSERNKRAFLGGAEDDEPGVTDHDPMVVAAIMAEMQPRWAK